MACSTIAKRYYWARERSTGLLGDMTFDLLTKIQINHMNDSAAMKAASERAF